MIQLFKKYYGVKSKNEGPFCAFTSDWFIKNQVFLLFLLNLPLIKVWFRWIFRIGSLVNYSDSIIEVQPDNFKIYLSEDSETTTIKGVFYSHQKFSKRIYFAFRWWWWTIHFIDQLFKPVWMPDVYFGFDTLTTYPLAGSSATDAQVSRHNVNETFSTIRSGAGTYKSSGSLFYLAGATTSNQFKYLSRGIFCFDTSSLTSSATITSGSLGLYGSTKVNSLGSSNIDIVTANPSNPANISYNDYNSIGSTALSSKSYSSFSTSGFNVFAIPTTNINKTGVSSFATRSTWDTDNSFGGTWGNNLIAQMTARYSSYSGTSSDPYLTVVYTIPVLGKKWNGITISKWNGITPSKINGV